MLFKKGVKEKENKIQQLIDQEINKVSIDIEKGSDYEMQLNVIGLEREDLALLKSIQPIVAKHLPAIRTESFHFSHEGMSKIIDTSRIGISTEDSMKYFLSFFNGKIDREYVQRRAMLAQMYVKIGVEIRWFLSVYHLLMTEIMIKVNQELQLNEKEATILFMAISKIFNLENQLVIDSMHNAQKNMIAKKEQEAKIDIKNFVGGFVENLAAMTEETGASVEQIVEQSGHIATSAKKSLASSIEMEERSENGKLQLDKVIKNMQELKEDIQRIMKTIDELEDNSKKIGGIVNVITGIADQTNLLALNAAIEAARAGEHGKGFAVVADEVRKLAEQTKDSSSSITELVQGTIAHIANVIEQISTINKVVDTGNHEIKLTTDVFDNILGSSRDNNKMIKSTENDLQLLIQLLEEINQAVAKMAVSTEELNETVAGF
ncbi:MULTISPECIES: globin-coupled sensor protein [Niallia]|jgi:heam-based aerotactic trancducer|uniref:Methyl-accepting transducer domain-containing protein n=1 Tax=Niallia circulans TaxID=1397 RepID=A0AA91TQ32_NIACI|nr:globin-coupled sensor protein [Niallia circulans]AYV71577.1 globin-coupled sensor protein [Niallia circulans]PAD81962.1 hypothetical protein CHH57_17355 [Niallia circulans]QJX61507.1 globin-coupled sensor protein [Niallia circulans]UQZ73944.1 globin-coupled sensor protein [Niallia circulans]